MIGRLLRGRTWLTGSLMLLMPILSIFFIASQMALGQVNSKFEATRNIPEVTRLADLQTLPPGAVVMLRGRISPTTCQRFSCASDPAVTEVMVYQERPAEGREVRFRETFDLVFPKLVLDVSDGSVVISPNLTRRPVMQHARHTVPRGDRQLSGFRPGDMVTVQGRWQPGQATSPPLVEATGITGSDKQRFMQDWQRALKKVQWVRNSLGVLTASGILILIGRLRRTRSTRQIEKSKSWQPQGSKNARPASRS